MSLAPRCLVVYASAHGHTERIARRVAGRLQDDGCDVALRDVAHAGECDVASFDAVVAAASVHAGAHQPALRDWLLAHRDDLADRPCALLSVSLRAAEDSDEARAEVRAAIDGLLRETDVAPSIVAAVGGALRYPHYSLPVRLLMQAVARRHGLPADRRLDVDFTDWDAVDTLAADVAGLARDRAGTPVGRA